MTFEHARSGVVDFTKYIEQEGVFSQLADRELSKKYKVNRELGALTLLSPMVRG